MILEPKDEAMIDAIIFQRLNNYNSIFNYDYDKGQEYLNGTGRSVKYVIAREDQFDIIQKLSNAGIIDMDYIVNVEFLNNLRSVTNSDIPLIESKEKFFWANQKKWAYEFYQLDGEIELEKVYEKYKSGVFIRMTKDDIAYIKKNYRASHIMQLALDRKRSCLKIKFDQDDWVFLTTLDATKAPYRILDYAYRHAGHAVKMSELLEAGIITEKESGKYMKSQMFSDNGTVQALDLLTTNEITFVKVRKITPAKLETLKTDLKII